MAAPNQMGGKIDVHLDYEHTKLDGKYAIAGWTVKVEIPGMGKYEEKTKVTYTKVGEYHVLDVAEAEGAMQGNTMTGAVARYST